MPSASSTSRAPGARRTDGLLRRRLPGASSFTIEDIYPDTRPTLERIVAMGYRTGAAGNMQADTESVLARSGLPLDFIGSSERWGVQKPDLRFFEYVIRAGRTTADQSIYVGDRIDNDILPTRAVGMRAVFVRRGPWAEVHATRPEAAAADRTIGTLADLPAVLEEWRSDPTRAKRPL